MRVAVDLTRCQGYGNCLSAAPELFDLGDDGLAVVLVEEPSAAQRDAARRAARMCPVAAIALSGDEEG